MAIVHKVIFSQFLVIIFLGSLLFFLEISFCFKSRPMYFEHVQITSKPAYMHFNATDIKLKSIAGSQHRLAILVPFRGCQRELPQFSTYMFNFLRDRGIRHKIYILNQVDSYRFNRAALINVGFKEMDNSCDYIAIHDVDLLPLNPKLDYGYPEKGVVHLAAPWLHPDNNKWPGYFGGILLMTRRQFEKVNGMANYFWGWGREDDDLLLRLRSKHLPFVRPNLTSNYNNTFMHTHNTSERTRDKNLYFNQMKYKYKFDMKSGLTNVQYTVDSRNITTVGGVPVTFLNIKLKCKHYLTPFCLQKKDHHQIRFMKV